MKISLCFIALLTFGSISCGSLSKIKRSEGLDFGAWHSNESNEPANPILSQLPEVVDNRANLRTSFNKISVRQKLGLSEGHARIPLDKNNQQKSEIIQNHGIDNGIHSQILHRHIIPIRPLNDEVPVDIPQPYAVTLTKEVPFLQSYPVQVTNNVPYAVPLPIHVKVPVEVPRPYPVGVTKTIPVEVEKIVYIGLPHLVTIPQPQPYPVHVPQPYAVHVPQPFVINNHQTQLIHESDHNSLNEGSPLDFQNLLPIVEDAKLRSNNLLHTQTYLNNAFDGQSVSGVAYTQDNLYAYPSKLSESYSPLSLHNIGSYYSSLPEW